MSRGEKIGEEESTVTAPLSTLTWSGTVSSPSPWTRRIRALRSAGRAARAAVMPS